MKKRTNSTTKAPASKAKAGKEDVKELFVDGLKDIYWAEKALTRALPKMVKNATSEELMTALQNHLEETEQQITRLEEVFGVIEQKPQAKKCEAMDGLINEADELMKEHEAGGIRDLAIISAGQKVEHYEIATYGTLSALAEMLGLDEAVELLQETLEEEKGADEKLTEVTPGVVSVEDEEEGDEEEEEEE